MSTQSNETPGAGGELAGDGAASGDSSGAHQDRPTGMQELSDSVGLTAGPGQAYEGFNPAVHAVDAAGKPLLRKGGGLQRKRGRKAGTPATGTAQTAPAVNGENPSPTMSVDEAAVFCVASTTAICTAVFGDDEWRVKDKAEFNGYVAAVKGYFTATGVPNFPPSLALIAAGFTYAAPRLDSEPTKTRIQKIAGWFAGKFGRK